jgi:hypothetical protein
MGMFDDIPSTGTGGGGMFDDIEAAPKSTLGDVATEGVKGLARGAESFAGDLGESIAGLPGRTARHFSNVLSDFGYGEREAEPEAYSSQLIKGTGVGASPQTTAGKYAGSIGEVIGNPATYFGPGGWLAKATQGVASGAGAEAAGELTGDNPLARFAGAALAGPIAGRMANPQLGGAAQRTLMQHGVEMTPGQLLGEGAGRAEDIAAGFPILGNFIRNARTRSVESFNKATANQALDPIGQSLGKRTEAGHEMVQEVEDKLDNAYNNLVPNLHFVPDRQYANDISRIMNDASQTMPQTHVDLLQRILDNRLGPNRWVQQINPNGSSFHGLQGPAFKQIESELTHLSRTYGRSMDGAQQLLGDSIGDVVKAMRSNLERSNPAYAQELRRINHGWAMFSRIRAAATNRVSSEGVFTPGDLLSAIKRGDSSVGRGMFGKGDALMQRFASAAQHVLPTKLANSGTPERLMMLGLPGMIRDAIANPVKAAAGLGAAGLTAGAYSPWGSRAINALARPTTGFRGRYAAAGRGAGLAKTLLTTPYGNDEESPYASGGVVRKDDGGGLGPDDAGAMSPETFNPFADWSRQAAGKDVQTLKSVGEGMAGIPRGIANLVDTAAETPYGLRREDVTDIPGSGQPADPLVGRAFDAAGNVTLGAGAMPAEANALRTGIGINAKTFNPAKFEQFKRLEGKGVSPEMNYSMSGIYRGSDEMPRSWLSDEGAKLKGVSIPAEGTTLGEIWDHPKLYEAYPWLKNVEVKPEANPDWGGHYDPESRSIHVGEGSPGEMEDTIHHEVVHAIQHHEGFASGANRQEFYPEGYAWLKAAYNKQEGDLHQAVANAGLDPWSARIIASKPANELNPFEKSVRDRIDQMGITPDLQRLKLAATEMAKVETAAHDRYLHVHGESEARDAPYLRRNPGALRPGQIPLHINPQLTSGREIEVRALGGRVANPYAWA